MSSPSKAARGRGFQSRLNRVAELRAPLEAAKPEVELLPDWKAKFKRPMSLATAVLIGMLAVFIARVGRFHLMGGLPSGEFTNFTVIFDGGLALVFSLLAFRVLKMNDRAFKSAFAGGVVAMVVLMHNFVHAAPGVFGLLFSKEWSANVVAYSEPGSIYLLSTYMAVMPSGADAANDPGNQVLPKVRRYGLISDGG